MEGMRQVEILLVEDNESDAELTLRALRRNNVVNNVVWVKDGVEALDFMFRSGSHANRTDGNPRLILLDLKLPMVDGIEVLRQLKSNPRTKMVPVVMMTSSAEERDILESYRLGINSYLVKPVDFNEFVNTVSQVGLYWAVLNKIPQ